MKYTLFLLIVIVLDVTGHGQDSVEDYLHAHYPAFELKSDLHFIRQKAEFKNYNATGLYFTGKERFNFLYDSILQVIDQKQEMSLLDFYHLSSKLIRELQDDQSVYSLVGESLVENDRLKRMGDAIRIPIASVVINDTAYISNSRLLPDNAQLLSINGMAATEIIGRTLKDAFPHQWQYLRNNGFALFQFHMAFMYIYTQYGFHDSVTVEFIRPGASLPEKQEIKLYEPGDTSINGGFKLDAKKQQFLSLRFDEDIAVLKVNNHYPFEINIDTLNMIFTSIRDKKIRALIIDISECKKSYDYFWMTLLNYLYTGEINLYGYHKDPVDLMKYTAKHLRKKDYVKGKISKIASNCRFDGDIYLVTGYGTRSSAVTFADILTFNQLATSTFGQETGDRTSRYDRPIHYYLPVTGLGLRLSTTLVKSLDHTRHTRGLLPDYPIYLNDIGAYQENIEQHNALILQKAIQIIRKKNQS